MSGLLSMYGSPERRLYHIVHTFVTMEGSEVPPYNYTYIRKLKIK